MDHQHGESHVLLSTTMFHNSSITRDGSPYNPGPMGSFEGRWIFVFAYQFLPLQSGPTRASRALQINILHVIHDCSHHRAGCALKGWANRGEFHGIFSLGRLKIQNNLWHDQSSKTILGSILFFQIMSPNQEKTTGMVVVREVSIFFMFGSQDFTDLRLKSLWNSGAWTFGVTPPPC